MNNESTFEGNQFVISYELLQLLQWLVDNEPEALQELVSLALEQGLYEKELLAPQDKKTHYHNSEELQQSIVDFFTLLETYIYETPQLSSEDTLIAEQSMLPTIDRVDSSICDENILATSMAQATSQLKSSGGKNAKELLYKELLKNWTPRDKRLLH